MPEAERRLAAIMFTDMVGFTTLTQRNESLALKLLEECRGTVRPLFEKYHGKEVKTIGDGFLTEFSSAMEAIRCAFAIQHSLHEYNDGRPTDETITVRIGIHVGDVIHAANDVFGDSVNIASRIEPLAKSGGICVTRQVYDQVRNKFEFPFVSLGNQVVKGVLIPVEVFSVALPWEKSGQTESAPLDMKRLAVLPLANISKDPGDEYFAEGMTGELISTISRVRGLRVIARTSVMHYRGQTKRVSEIGSELKVGTLLEGSVRKSGDRIRISVQLIDASSEEHLWAEDYERRLEDVFQIQRDIATKVAHELRVKLLPEEMNRIERKDTGSSAAFTLYLKGRHYWSERTEEGVRRAVKYFEEALKADERFAKAHTGLADCYLILADYEWMAPATAGELAKENAMKALAIDSSLAEAHASLGLAYVKHSWDFVAGEKELNRAIELNPNYVPAYHWYSVLLAFMGRYEDSLQMIKRAAELDPHSIVIRQSVGVSLMGLERYEEAMDQFKKVEHEKPDLPSVHFWMSLVHLAQSTHAKAIEEAKTEVELDEYSNGAKLDLAFVQSEAGRKEEALKTLEEVLSEKGVYYSPSSVGIVMLSIGREEEAFDWMQRAYSERDSSLLYLRSVPAYRKYLSNPAWVEIERKIGFPHL